MLPEQRELIIAELVVLVDIVGDVAAAHFVWLFEAKPRHHEEALMRKKSIAQLKTKLRVVEEGSTFYSGRLG